MMQVGSRSVAARARRVALGSYLTGTAFQFGKMTYGGWLHSIVNVLNTAKMHT